MGRIWPEEFASNSGLQSTCHCYGLRREGTSQLQCWIGCWKEPISSMRPYNKLHGGHTEPSVALMTSWEALREVMRSWGIRAREDLSDWLGQHGFPRSSPGSHVPARAQERLIHEACCRDARVALLETFCVAIALPSENQQRTMFMMHQSHFQRLCEVEFPIQGLNKLLRRVGSSSIRSTWRNCSCSECPC